MKLFNKNKLPSSEAIRYAEKQTKIYKQQVIKATNDYIQLQSNWNSLREWLKNKIDNFQDDVSEPILHEQMTMRVIYEYMENLDKMNELERKDNNE